MNLDVGRKDLQAIQTMLDASVKESENRMMSYFESAILPKFDLLADGQKTIMDAITPESEIEALRSKVEILEIAVRSMNKEIAELKKAQ